MPKSAILTFPRRVSSTFSGFRSRWAMPWSLRVGEPGQRALEHAKTCGSSSVPTSDRSDPPATYSIAM